MDNINQLPDSFRMGIMTLLHKKDDKTDLKKWRPVTLLNFDCKLFSKLLKGRMSTVLADLIHSDQACAVPERKITDSLVLIRDAMLRETEILDYLMVMSGVSQEEVPAHMHTKLWLTLNCIKDAIWTSRNLLVGKRMPPRHHTAAGVRRMAPELHKERCPWPRALTAVDAPEQRCLGLRGSLKGRVLGTGFGELGWCKKC